MRTIISSRHVRSAALRAALMLGALLGAGMLDATGSAHAQGAWCAYYSGRDGGATNCGFYTLQQCRWAVSGVGGVCAESPYPVRIEQPLVRRKPRRVYR